MNEEERYLKEIKEYVEKGDDGSLLQTLNEYIGYLREMARYEESYVIGEKIISLAESMGLKGSIPYATCLLNIANAYRAGGELAKSLELYKEVEKVYTTSLPNKSMLIAGFYNNKALLYQEMGDIQNAIASLEMALLISEYNDEKYEIAVTHANLANTYLARLEYNQAKEQALLAVSMFKKQKVEDDHLAAALYVLGVTMGEEGEEYLERALKIVEERLGKTEFYYRIQDALKIFSKGAGYGIKLSRELYTKFLAKAIEEKLPEYKEDISVALFGRGSDCFGYDDELSRDHDWGPDLCILVSKDVYEEIGPRLEEIYNELPDEINGSKKAKKVSTHKRRGVFVYEDYFKDLLTIYPLNKEDYALVPEYAFSLATNGEIFYDPKGTLKKMRDDIINNMPESFRYLKIAELASMFSQTGQYNLLRVKRRGDEITEKIMLGEALKYAMKLAHVIDRKPIPHDKWLKRSSEDLSFGSEICNQLREALRNESVEKLGMFFADLLYKEGIISDSDDYLDHHKDEIIYKSTLVDLNCDELIEKIVKAEFAAFDKVKNEGGRASCQDDFYTFNIMRRSQYMIFTKDMLIQYLYDFMRELNRGHNLITEKYGRMMESTNPSEYENFKDTLPVISEEKKAIIDAIAAIQVSMMDEFAVKYPKLSIRARSIHTEEDNTNNTSYETYLRGEISTYSDKMLELYGRMIVSYANQGKNVSFLIMENNCKLYGYASLDAAEAKAY